MTDENITLSDEQEAALRDRLALNPSFEKLREDYAAELEGKSAHEQIDFVRKLRREKFMDLAAELTGDVHRYLLENQIAIGDETLRMLVAENAISSILFRIIDSIDTIARVSPEVAGAVDASFITGFSNEFEDAQMLALSEDEDTGQLRAFMDQHHVRTEEA